MKLLFSYDFANCKEILHTAAAIGLRETLWPESASELYQPSDCRVSAKLLPTFGD
jgi:hypothetical protein